MKTPMQHSGSPDTDKHQLVPVALIVMFLDWSSSTHRMRPDVQESVEDFQFPVPLCKSAINGFLIRPPEICASDESTVSPSVQKSSQSFALIKWRELQPTPYVAMQTSMLTQALELPTQYWRSGEAAEFDLHKEWSREAIWPSNRQKSNVLAECK